MARSLPGQAEGARMLAVPVHRPETSPARPAADAAPPAETAPDAPPSDEADTSSDAEPDRIRDDRPCPGCGRLVSAAVQFSARTVGVACERPPRQGPRFRP